MTEITVVSSSTIETPYVSIDLLTHRNNGLENSYTPHYIGTSFQEINNISPTIEIEDITAQDNEKTEDKTLDDKEVKQLYILFSKFNDQITGNRCCSKIRLHLKRFNIEKMRKKVYEYISILEKMEIFDLSNMRLKRIPCLLFKYMPNLTKLYISMNEKIEIRESDFVHLNGLTYLMANSCDLRNEDLNIIISSLPNLTHLNIQYNPRIGQGDYNAIDFAKFEKILLLNVRVCNINADFLVKLINAISKQSSYINANCNKEIGKTMNGEILNKINVKNIKGRGLDVTGCGLREGYIAMLNQKICRYCQ
jgi:hypothetical protein